MTDIDERPNYWYSCLPSNLIQPFVISCDICNLQGQIKDVDTLALRLYKLNIDHKEGKYSHRSAREDEEDRELTDYWLMIKGKDRMGDGPI